MSYTALDCDKYALTMMQGFWKQGRHQERVVCDAFFRKNPFQNGYTVFAGLTSIIDYLKNLRVDEESLAFLSQDPLFEQAFIEDLKILRFTGTVYAAREGDLIFPNETVLRIETTMWEALLIEAQLLLLFNSQSLFATKASRMVQAAKGKPIIELGKRRAQGNDASIDGARAAYLAGLAGTSNMHAGQKYGIPTVGTMAHFWIQTHDTELEAFRQYAALYGNASIFLVDTYDTLRSGVPHAIRVAKEMEQRGEKLKGIRLDSGDIAYLSKMARKMLDEASLPYVQIVASNDLDETIMADLQFQGALVDVWGVGTKLITAYEQPALGGVYKIVAREKNDFFLPVIKISENPEKIPNPGIKQVYRIVDQETGKFKGDLITLEHECLEVTQPLHMVHPTHTYLQKTVHSYTLYPLLTPVIEQGEVVMDLPSLEESRQFHQQQLDRLWPEYKRRTNPEVYPVSLSNELYDLKKQLLLEKGRQV